jgi:hypothetical protein
VPAIADSPDDSEVRHLADKLLPFLGMKIRELASDVHPVGQRGETLDRLAPASFRAGVAVAERVVA